MGTSTSSSSHTRSQKPRKAKNMEQVKEETMGYSQDLGNLKYLLGDAIDGDNSIRSNVTANDATAHSFHGNSIRSNMTANDATAHSFQGTGTQSVGSANEATANSFHDDNQATFQ